MVGLVETARLECCEREEVVGYCVVDEDTRGYWIEQSLDCEWNDVHDGILIHRLSGGE